MTVERKAAVRPRLLSIAVPYAERSAGPGWFSWTPAVPGKRRSDPPGWGDGRLDR
jgi:hypothetical protein